MKNQHFILAFFILTACSSLKKDQRPSINISHKTLNQIMAPGEAKLLSFQVLNADQNIKLFCDGKKMSTQIFNNQLETFISIPYEYDKKSYECILKHKENILGKVVSATIKKVKYKTSYIKVPKRKVDLKPSDLKWYLQDKEELQKAYANLELENVYFNKPFISPLNSKITSPYGAKRIFNNKKSSWHNGIDFKAKIGTPIPSTNRGKVILVRHLFFNGKTVIVDHGMGIISLYCHLSDYSVKVGDIVEQGDILGLAGNTGRSSGPHLHWGIRVQENWVNGFGLIDQSQSASLYNTLPMVDSTKIKFMKK